MIATSRRGHLQYVALGGGYEFEEVTKTYANMDVYRTLHRREPRIEG